VNISGALRVVVVVVRLVGGVVNSLSNEVPPNNLGIVVVVDFLLFFLLFFLFLFRFLRLFFLFFFFFRLGLSLIFFLGLLGLFRFRLGLRVVTATLVEASGLDGGTRSMSRLNQTNLNGDGTGVGGPDGKSLLLPPILLPPVKLL